jgi:hypothetical protein
MKAYRPPALATWLLENLGSDPRNDQIVGDLMEQYASGRTRAWYWRQATVAILGSFLEQINSHKLLALRALAVGWLARYFLKEAAMALRPAISPWSARLPVLAFLVLWTVWLFNCAFTGWIVGRFHRASRVAMVLLFSFSVVLWREQVVQWPLHIDAPWVFYAGMNALRDSRYAPAFADGLLGTILVTLCILLGGFYAAPSKAPRANSAAAAH